MQFAYYQLHGLRGNVWLASSLNTGFWVALVSVLHLDLVSAFCYDAF
jgi:hypothetical protein